MQKNLNIQRFDDEELLAMLDDGESGRVERKSQINRELKGKMCEAVCAFANDLPNHQQAGVLFVGANDDGSPSHIRVDEELLNSLAGLKTDNDIVPSPTLYVEKRKLKGADMAVVVVMPSDSSPVRYKGRVLVSVGTKQGIATGQEERILIEKRRHKDSPFDARPVARAKLSDLYKTAFEEEYLPAAFAPDVLEANDRAYEERLAACKMIASPDDPTPTVVGLLAVGKKPQDFVYGSYIQFLRIDGADISDPIIDAEEIGGRFNQMLSAIKGKILAYNAVSYDAAASPNHITYVAYPPVALEQIIYNAVMHKNYESGNAPVRVHWHNDRVEVISMGGPCGDVTPQNFAEARHTAYRNLNIAEALKNLGHVQRFGSGIRIAQQALEKNGSPPMEFIVDDSHVCCIVRKAPPPAR